MRVHSLPWTGAIPFGGNLGHCVSPSSCTYLMVWQPTAWQLCPHKCHLPLEHNSFFYTLELNLLSWRRGTHGQNPAGLILLANLYLREGRGGERKTGRGQGGMAREATFGKRRGDILSVPPGTSAGLVLSGKADGINPPRTGGASLFKP